MIHYPNEYQHYLKLKNSKYSSLLKDEIIQRIVLNEVNRLNAYYQYSSRRQVRCKKYFSVSFEGEQMVITFETEYPLPNPNRKGQCMRQFSIFLLAAGFDQYLTSYNPKKLLSA
ncbi:hypothetical protein [Trichococcus shcherbakoviae]|uniref:Uncharacterized protein n=1 Tax=Trichococcus shcherbakoviae TaxID=2094020 RepID=A0A383TD51_9LACT|nr:hypothetical protein [Trichococcus shcherbakoviae]SYZ77876.1 Hypothetical protein TART1_0646 [Trichococcus shcherbakoviae]